MNYVMPIDYQTKKLIAVLSIEGDLSKDFISDYKIPEILYLNTNLEWIDLSVPLDKIRKDFEHDSYGRSNIKNERQVLNSIFTEVIF